MLRAQRSEYGTEYQELKLQTVCEPCKCQSMKPGPLWEPVLLTELSVLRSNSSTARDPEGSLNSRLTWFTENLSQNKQTGGGLTETHF